MQEPTKIIITTTQDGDLKKDIDQVTADSSDKVVESQNSIQTKSMSNIPVKSKDNSPENQKPRSSPVLSKDVKIGIEKDTKPEQGCFEKTFLADKPFWILIAALFVANFWLHQNLLTGAWTGFTLAAYSAVSNDSIQTLGTFIASNKDYKWWQKWLWINSIFVATVIYSWVEFDGDISFQRLGAKGFDEAPTSFTYFQLGAPIILMVLTRLKVPVSTTFMILTAFVSESKGLGGMITKSLTGYVICIILGLLVYLPFSKCLVNYCNNNRGKFSVVWTYLQWLSTGFLWSTWLQQDMANKAVFLPRQLELHELIIVVSVISLLMAYMLHQGGEKIQQIVEEKSKIQDIPEASLVDFILAIVLYFFKVKSKIPMSTTWCFIGLLSGREISMALRKSSNRTLKDAIIITLKDLSMMTVGFIISLVVGIGANPAVTFKLQD